MRLKALLTVARREYLVRVRSPIFWFSTLALPVFILALAVLPALLAEKMKSAQRLAVLDPEGLGVLELLEAELRKPKRKPEDLPLNAQQKQSQTRLELVPVALKGSPQEQAEELDRKVRMREIDAWIQVDRQVLEGQPVRYHAESVANLLTQEELSEALTRVVTRLRLEQAGLSVEEVLPLIQRVSLETVRITEEGAKKETAVFGFFLAYLLFFLLFMMVTLYGTQVLNGVLEEKSSRVVEVLLAAVHPFELLAGKLAGIGLVALTQLGVWLATLLAVSSPGLVAAWVSFSDQLPEFSPLLAVHFLLHFALGFALYAALYAAVGAATNNLQEAQQLSGIVVPFLIAPVLLLLPILNDPDSTLSVVLSLVPPFTPLLMLLRIAVKMPPLWQVLLGYLLSAAFVGLVVWLSARIYRVGILMYGKRPTAFELWRWIRARQ